MLTLHQKWERNQKANGLCVLCTQPSLVGRLCGYHLTLSRRYERERGNKEERKKNWMKRYHRLKEEGRCTKCGIDLEGLKLTRCTNCKDIGGRRQYPKKRGGKEYEVNTESNTI